MEAYIGSWSLVLGAVQRQVGNANYPVLGPLEGTPTTARLATQAALDELPQGALDVTMAMQSPVPKLQKKLTQERYRQDYMAMLTSLDPVEATLLSNLASKGTLALPSLLPTLLIT